MFSLHLADQMSYNGIQVDACVEEERSTSAIIARPMVTDPDGDQLTWTLLDSTGSFSIGKNSRYY